MEYETDVSDIDVPVLLKLQYSIIKFLEGRAEGGLEAYIPFCLKSIIVQWLIVTLFRLLI